MCWAKLCLHRYPWHVGGVSDMQIRSHTHTHTQAKGELVTSLKTANASAVKQPLFPLPPTAEQSMSTSTCSYSSPPHTPTSTHTPKHTHAHQLRPLAHPLVCRCLARSDLMHHCLAFQMQQPQAVQGGRRGSSSSQRAVRSFSPFSCRRKNVMHLCLAFVSRCL